MTEAPTYVLKRSNRMLPSYAPRDYTPGRFRVSCAVDRVGRGGHTRPWDFARFSRYIAAAGIQLAMEFSLSRFS